MAGGKKEHVDKVRESKFNRQRCETPELRSNCGSEGYVFAKALGLPPEDRVVAAGQCEFHHVLPITTLQDPSIMNDELKAAEKDFIHKCMAKTTWDINKQPNLIGLPTKRPYENADRRIAKEKDTAPAQRVVTAAFLRGLDAAGANFGSLPDLPCHLNDHPTYNGMVISMLNDAVWPKILDNHDECVDNSRCIRKALVDQSKHWKDRLQKRGREHGGAADCWVNRFDKKSVWYIPLSMDLGTPQPQEPPPNIFVEGKQSKAKVKEWMKIMFEFVK